MKTGKIVGVFFLSIALCAAAFFLYTRFVMDQYTMEGNTMKYNDAVYVRSETSLASDEENLGKTIGIAIEGKRTLTDLVWPYWVIEYQNDKEHNRLFVRGLMGSGGIYVKVK